MDRSPLPTPSVSRRKGRSLSAVGQAAALVAALVAGACTAGGTPTTLPASPVATTAAPTVAATPAPSPSAALVQPSFPLTIRDDEGTRVTIPRKPARIVSLTPASTEELFALGEGSLLVGDTDSDDYPAAAKSLPHVATFQGVIMEQLVAAQPDLVIAGGDGFTHPADVAHMRSLGIPVVVIYAPTVPAVLADLRLVGEVSGQLPAAIAMTDAMQTRIDAIATLARAEPTHHTVFYEIGVGPGIYAPAEHSFVADMVELAGGTPITTGDPNSYTIALEKLVVADPQVIVLGDYDYGTTVADVLERPGWEHLTAVVSGAIRPVDDTIVTRPGPRLVDGLAALALAIDPDLVLPADLLPPPTPVPSPS